MRVAKKKLGPLSKKGEGERGRRKGKAERGKGELVDRTSQVKLAVPVLLGVIAAWTVSSWLSQSIYDSILELRGIPLLPIEPRHPTNLDVKPPRPFVASDIMSTEDFPYLNQQTNIREIAFVLAYGSHHFLPPFPFPARHVYKAK